MTSHDLIIVGGGPRGISLIERLSARQPATPVRVLMIDRVEIGAGATWRTDQTPHFLNNTYAADTTIYPDDSTPMAGPVTRGPDLMDWVIAVAQGEGQFRSEKHTGWQAPPRPSWVAAEARDLQPWDFPTRRIQGVYYREQLERILDRGYIHLDAVVGEVVNLLPEEGSRRVELNDGRVFTAPYVVLAQGMVQAQDDAHVRRFTSVASTRGLTYIPPGMPSERDFSILKAGENALIAGLGANFFDVITLVTQGRGGRFHPRTTLFDLEYEPNGKEPHFFVGSRRGLPYRSKSFYGGLPPAYEPQLATDAWFAYQENKPHQDFSTAIWPVFQREFTVAHLATLARHHPEVVPTLTVVQPPHGWEDPAGAPLPAEILDQISACPPSNLHQLVQTYVTDPRYHFDPMRLDRPDIHPGESWQEWVKRWIDAERQSITTPFLSPRASVNRAMARLRRRLGRLVRAGGIDPVSEHRDIEGWFAGISLALASGPPPGRTARLLALVEAGIITMMGESTSFGITGENSPSEQNGQVSFFATSPHMGTVYATQFAETRMSKGNVDVTNDPLLVNLLKSGQARLHQKISPTGEVVTTRTLDVTPDTFSLIGEGGVVDNRTKVLGIPAGDVQPGSAIGASPNVPSPLLAGADAVAELITLNYGSKPTLLAHTSKPDR